MSNYLLSAPVQPVQPIQPVQHVPYVNKPLYNNDEEDTTQDTTQDTTIMVSCKDSTGKYIYFIFHIIMALVAVFLTWKCNNGKFNVLSFIIALLFPYVYIIYILATRGTCDRF